MLNVNTIKYDVYLTDNDFNIVLPNNITWNTIKEPERSDVFCNVTSKKAAEIFFNSVSKNNWQAIIDFFPMINKMETEKQIEFKEYLTGLTIIEIGDAFKSGAYPGVFIPYKIKLNNGEIIEHNLAIRNDNSNKVWQFDGGL